MLNRIFMTIKLFCRHVSILWWNHTYFFQYDLTKQNFFFLIIQRILFGNMQMQALWFLDLYKHTKFAAGWSMSLQWDRIKSICHQILQNHGIYAVTLITL